LLSAIVLASNQALKGTDRLIPLDRSSRFPGRHER